MAFSAGQILTAAALNDLSITTLTTTGTITVGAFTLPATDGTASQVLVTNGAGTVTWQDAAGGSPGGSDGYVQYNNGGAFGGSASLTFDDATGDLSVGGILYYGNTAIVANDTGTGTNIDHIWHDDSTNSWHFCSDTTYRATGNSTLRAGDAVLSGSLTTEGVDGGAVIGYTYNTGYCGLRTAGMGVGSEYVIMSNGTNTFISGGAGGSVSIRGGNNSTTAQIEVSTSSTTVTGNLSVTGRVYTDLIGAYGGDALGIGAGETSNVMSGNLAGEHLWLGAEGSTYIVTSPDNWASGWAGRYETRLTPNSSGTLRLQSNGGYVDIGPNNTGYCHFYTDRANYYFNTWIMPDGGIRTYDLGTASAPTLSFRSDTDTGVYRYTTNQLGLTAGNNTGCIVASGTIITASPATSTTSGYQYVLRNNTFGTLYRFTSKREMKEQITTFDDAGSIIDSLRPVTFVPAFQPGPTTPDDQDDEFDPTVETDEQRALREADLQYGFIADEIAEVAGGKLAQWEWTDTGLEPAGWKWPDMIAVLVAEVKALRSRVATLEGAAA